MKAAIYLKRLNKSQQAYSIPANATVFVDDYTGVQMPFTILPSSELFCYNGDVVASCLDTACTILQSVTIRKKYLYMWDLDWIRPQFRDYIWNQNILQNPELTIVTRSGDYANEIKKYCYRDAKVMHFNLEKICGLE